MVSLPDLFNTLALPVEGTKATLTACSILGYNHRLAKGVGGAPSILLSVVDAVVHERPISAKLEHLTVQYDARCRISSSDEAVEEGCFTVISCAGGDPVLYHYFLKVMESVIGVLGQTPAKQQVSTTVDKLIELFQALVKPPRKSVQGLWAELVIIAKAQDAETLVRAWHVFPEDRYDFSLDNQRLEVKGTSKKVRQHQFSLEQLTPDPQVEVLAGSMFIERAGGGTSLSELVEEVRDRVSHMPELLLHVDRTVGMTLGSNWRNALEERFDRHTSESSLAFYDINDIPCIDKHLPKGVSEVRLVADLTTLPHVDMQRCRSAGGLFKHMLRRR